MHNQQREPQPYEDCQAKSIQEFGWTFSKNGLRLGSRHQEPPHTDVSRNLATFVVRGVLPGLRRRRIGLLPSGPKFSFQMRASFEFNLETKVLESGGRVEKLIAQVAWSPVLSFHSLWWFEVQCHLLVLVHCVFWKPTSLHQFTKKFGSTSCFLLLTSFLKMLISFSSRIWHLHFSWAELKDLRLFLCTQKAYFSQILFTNLSKSVLVSTTPLPR